MLLTVISKQFEFNDQCYSCGKHTRYSYAVKKEYGNRRWVIDHLCKKCYEKIKEEYNV